ncbi:hypothetical protein PIB30_114456, partial [Stylosanthes scabra]|nr:hypothetical protein [Stylosanthes scabra]
GGGANFETVNVDENASKSVGAAGGIVFKTPILGSDSSSDVEIIDGKGKATNEKCDDGKGKGKAEEDVVKSKSPMKDFTRKKKRRSRRNGESNNVAGPSADNGSGPEKNGTGPSKNGGGRPNMKYYQPQLVSSDEEYAYEYEPETLHTPVSTDGEDGDRHQWA